MNNEYRDPNTSSSPTPPPPPSGGPVYSSQPPTYSNQGWDPNGAPVQREDTSMAVLAHLSTIVSMIISVGWLSFVGPLVVWFLYKDRSPFVRQAAAGAFNFNIGMWIANAIAWVLFITVIGIPIALVIWVVAGIMMIVCHILGTLRAMKGETFRYPFALPILR